MSSYNIDTFKFSSGLTYKESNALVDALADKYLNEYGTDDKDLAITMLKSHLARVVRDHKEQREIVAACL